MPERRSRQPGRLTGICGRVACLLIAAGLPGCAARLYDQQQHSLAVAAQTAFKEASLSGSLEQERSLLQQLSQRDVAVARRHTLALRDRELAVLVGSSSREDTWGRLWTNVTGRIEDLAGEAAPEVAAALEALPDTRLAMEHARTLYRHAKAPADPALSCPLPDDFPEPREGARDAVSRFRKHCNRLIERRDEVVAAGGIAGALARSIRDAERANADLVQEVNARNAEYRQAARAYEAAAARDDTADLQEKARELRKALDGFSLPEAAEADSALDGLHLGDLRLGAAIQGIEHARASVNEVLDALIAGEAQPADGALVLRVASLLPSLTDEIGAALDDTRVSSLLLESERLRIRADALARRLQRARERLGYNRAKLDAMGRELADLIETLQSLRELGLLDGSLDADGGSTPGRAAGAAAEEPAAASCPTGSTLVADFEAADADCRTLIANALVAWANSWSRGRVHQEEADQRILASLHLAALDSTEVALAQWENLVGVPLAELAALHGAGIRAEDIGNLISAVGLGAIALGVN